MAILGLIRTAVSKVAVAWDDTTQTNEALLSICYTQGPTITTSGTLTPFSSQPGVPSTPQTYTVSGSNLTADISIAAPTGFEIKTGIGEYGPSLTLPYGAGTVAPTSIDVRLNSATEGTPSGNISHTSVDATTRNVAVSGAVWYVYTLTAGNDGNGSVTLSPTGGSYNHGATVTLTPVPNTDSNSAIGPVTTPCSYRRHRRWSYTIVMDEDKTVSANFELLADHTLTTAVSPDGVRFDHPESRHWSL